MPISFLICQAKCNSVLKNISKWDHINKIGTVFTDETVCVLIRAAFPWCIRRWKVKGHSFYCSCYLLMR